MAALYFCDLCDVSIPIGAKMYRRDGKILCDGCARRARAVGGEASSTQSQSVARVTKASSRPEDEGNDTDAAGDLAPAEVRQLARRRDSVAVRTSRVESVGGLTDSVGKVAAAAGCAVGGMLYVGGAVLGLVIHVWTIVLAFHSSGIIAAVISLVLPVLSEAYWFISIWTSTGSAWNPYCMSILGYCVLGLILGQAKKWALK